MSQRIIHTTNVLLSKINKFMLDTLFPVQCLSCRKEGFWICEPCFSKISLLNEQLCGVCEKVITPYGLTCIPCKKKSALSGLTIASSYKNQLISKAVHLFKYSFVSDLSIPLGNVLLSAIEKTEIPLPDIIVPVPLHPRRKRWRGFNQSALLAKHIAENLLPQTEMECDENILIRTRYTPPQMKIKKHSDRRQNIINAFSVRTAERIKGKTILLVDDIATTGSTILECARVLKNAGSGEIYAIVIARQEIKS